MGNARLRDKENGKGRRGDMSDGSTPRGTVSDGSTPRADSGAAMARSVGSKPRDISGAGMAHTLTSSRGADANPASDGRKRHTSAKLGVEKPSKRSSSMASPRELFPPTKQLTDAELALAARQSRLRREAADAESKVSAAEGVRERFSAPARDAPIRGPECAETSSATKRSAARNNQRLMVADESDAVIIGESTLIEACSSLRSGGQGVSFLSADAETFFPPPLLGPDDSFEPPSWFLEAVRGICQAKTRTPTKPPFRFEEGELAAAHNAALLQRFDYDLGKVIGAHGKSTLGFGSEFRTVEELRPLLGRHVHFDKLADLLTNGMEYVFNRTLSEEERAKEVKAMLARGNHKSAQEEQGQVGKLIAKDVLHGFTIPIPVGIVEAIPGAMVQPLGLVKQWTVGLDGERVIKYRLTQDLSFSSDRTAEPVSINARVDMEYYPEMIYGWCLPRIIHYVVALRIHNPTLLIFISKYDYSDAYRRIAHSSGPPIRRCRSTGTRRSSRSA